MRTWLSKKIRRCSFRRALCMLLEKRSCSPLNRKCFLIIYWPCCVLLNLGKTALIFVPWKFIVFFIPQAYTLNPVSLEAEMPRMSLLLICAPETYKLCIATVSLSVCSWCPPVLESPGIWKVSWKVLEFCWNFGKVLEFFCGQSNQKRDF